MDANSIPITWESSFDMTLTSVLGTITSGPFSPTTVGCPAGTGPPSALNKTLSLPAKLSSIHCWSLDFFLV